MTKFIFHGGGTRSSSEGNNSFYAELVKNAPENGRVLFVYFASREEDNSKRIEQDIKKCQEFEEGKKLQFTVATTENFLEEIRMADAVYFSGGSTENLLTTLKNYPNLKEKLVGKTVAGSSAGAYALSTFFSSHYEDNAVEGLGIAPVRVVTHFESSTMPPKPGAIEHLKNTAQELELIVLKEGEWKVVVV